jgi:cell division protein FtsI/penicillin-binding protein 2
MAAATAASVLAAGVGFVRCASHLRRAPVAPNESPPLVQVEPRPASPAPPPESANLPADAPVPGLDLIRIGSDDAGFFAPAAGGTAHLTLDPELQTTTVGLLAAHHLPEAAVVVMETATGRVLAYASHVEHAPRRDLCVEATAPSASVFKIVTAAALVEDAHLDASTTQCYSGGEQRISSGDLVDDPRRDRWCTTLAGAMGRSINTVFARLASTRLTPAELETMARRFGYGDTPAFDVPVQPAELRMPAESLEFARTAAGFWNTTLSPLFAAELSAIVARGGDGLRPRIVEKVVSNAGPVVWSAPEAPPPRRAIGRDTAAQLTTMMERTVREGTCSRAFHDGRGAPFLPGVTVAGKTGTLTDAEAQRFYTWFTGFAPSKARDDLPQVAIAVLVVNGPTWEVKANVIAREVLRAYFAEHEVAGVTKPSLRVVASRRHPR